MAFGLAHSLVDGSGRPVARSLVPKTTAGFQPVSPIPVVQEHEIPLSISGLDAISSDYMDAFVAFVPGASTTPAEQWARGTMEGASAAGRFMIWRVLCNLELGPHPSPEHIAGWQIVEGGDSWIRLQAHSWFMTANVIFRVDDSRVWFATLIHYRNAVGRAVWASLSVLHRAIAPDFLRAGVVRLRRRGSLRSPHHLFGP